MRPWIGETRVVDTETAHGGQILFLFLDSHPKLGMLDFHVLIERILGSVGLVAVVNVACVVAFDFAFFLTFTLGFGALGFVLRAGNDGFDAFLGFEPFEGVLQIFQFFLKSLDFGV